MGHVLRLQAAVIVFVVASGCGPTGTGQAEKKAAPPTADGGAKQPAPTNDDQAATEKAPSRATLAERFEKVESELAEIAAKVAALPDEARAEWSKTVEHLEADARAMRKKLGDLEEPASDAWNDLREEAIRAWENLERAVKKVAAEIHVAEGSKPSPQPAPDMPVVP